MIVRRLGGRLLIFTRRGVWAVRASTLAHALGWLFVGAGVGLCFYAWLILASAWWRP